MSQLLRKITVQWDVTFCKYFRVTFRDRKEGPSPEYLWGPELAEGKSGRQPQKGNHRSRTLVSAEFKPKDQMSQLSRRLQERKETTTLTNFIPKAVNCPKRTKRCPLISAIWWRFLPTSAFAGPHCHSKLTLKITNRTCLGFRQLRDLRVDGVNECILQSWSPEAPVGEAWLSQGGGGDLSSGVQGGKSSYCWGQDPGARHNNHSSCVALAPSRRKHFLPGFCYKNGMGRKKHLECQKRWLWAHVCLTVKTPHSFPFHWFMQILPTETKHQMQSYELPGWHMFKIPMKYTQYTLMLFKQPQYILSEKWYMYRINITS